MSFATPNVGADKYTGYSYEGKPIVLAKKRGGSLKQSHHNDLWQPEDKRIEVATLWAATRDLGAVSEMSGVSVYVIKKWKEEPWFHNVVSRVIKDKNDVLDKKLTDVIDSCATLIQERLTKGDTKVNYKTGEVYTAPLDARGLALVMGILFDKRQLIRGEATSRTENVSFDKRLENLKETFERFSKAAQIEGEVIHAEDQSKESKGRTGQEAHALLDNDSQVGEGVSSDIPFGQENVQEGNVESSSQEKTEADRIL